MYLKYLVGIVLLFTLFYVYHFFLTVQFLNLQHKFVLFLDLNIAHFSRQSHLVEDVSKFRVRQMTGPQMARRRRRGRRHHRTRPGRTRVSLALQVWTHAFSEDIEKNKTNLFPQFEWSANPTATAKLKSESTCSADLRVVRCRLFIVTA